MSWWAAYERWWHAHPWLRVLIAVGLQLPWFVPFWRRSTRQLRENARQRAELDRAFEERDRARRAELQQLGEQARLQQPILFIHDSADGRIVSREQLCSFAECSFCEYRRAGELWGDPP